MAQEQQLLRQEKERLQREARSSATELVHAREKVGDGSDSLLSKILVCPLCSAPRRPHLEHRIPFWVPQFQADVQLLERSQWRAAEVVGGHQM